MPDVDFRQFFPPPTQNAVASPDQEILTANAISQENELISKRRRLRNLAWATTISIVLSFLGAVFCALHFFNSPESFRRFAFAAPRELLYSQPTPAERETRVEISKRAIGGGSQTESGSKGSSDRNANSSPFAQPTPSVPPISPAINNPNSFPRSTNSNPGASGNRANTPAASRSAASSESAGRAETNSKQAKSRDANRIVQVIVTPVSKDRQREHSQAASASNVVTKTTVGASCSNPGKNSQSASDVASSTQNRGGAAIRASNDSSRQALENLRAAMAASASFHAQSGAHGGRH